MKNQKIDWVTTLFLFLTPPVALAGVIYHVATQGFVWPLWVTLLVGVFFTNLGITAGYHRYFAHRSYEAHPLIKFVLVVLGTISFQSSVIKWATDHRRHHKYVDTARDPYNIKQGFWYAHLGWLIHETEADFLNTAEPDLKRDKILMFQHKYYVWLAIALGFLIPMAIGGYFGSVFNGFLFGGVLRIVICHHGTFFVNSLCHMRGRQPYTDLNSARDNLFVAILTNGEGYHNYHHQFQADYRNGVRWYQYDPTKWIIQVWAWIGLARRLNRASPVAILKARVRMDEKAMLMRGVSADHLEVLKSKVFAAQLQFRQLKKDYKLLRKNFEAQSHEQLLRLKADLQIARIEFKKAYAQWKAYIATLRPLPVV